MISILIIDDHPIVLEGSKHLLNDMEDIKIETESHPKNVLHKMQRAHYDVYLIDINMTEQNGISLAATIKAAQPDASIILYTGDDIRSYYPLIIEKKVDGLLSKTATREKVIQTIRTIAKGDIMLPADFIDYINQKMQNKYDTLKLTNKEKQLMTLLIEGYTNKMMADKLGVTQRTVERYLTQLFALLGVSSRTQAIEIVQNKKLL